MNGFIIIFDGLKLIKNRFGRVYLIPSKMCGIVTLFSKHAIKIFNAKNDLTIINHFAIILTYLLFNLILKLNVYLCQSLY